MCLLFCHRFIFIFFSQILKAFLLSCFIVRHVRLTSLCLAVLMIGLIAKQRKCNDVEHFWVYILEKLNFIWIIIETKEQCVGK